MAPSKAETRILLRLATELVEAIEDFQHECRFKNRAQAIRFLLEYALKKAPRTKLPR